MNKEFIPKQLEKYIINLGMTYKVLASKRYNGIPVNGIVEQWTVGILYSTAFRWFREKYDLLCYIKEYKEDDDFISYEAVIQTPNGYYGGFGTTYEEAELACLEKLIEIVKNK